MEHRDSVEKMLKKLCWTKGIIKNEYFLIHGGNNMIVTITIRHLAWFFRLHVCNAVRQWYFWSSYFGYLAKNYLFFLLLEFSSVAIESYYKNVNKSKIFFIYLRQNCSYVHNLGWKTMINTNSEAENFSPGRSLAYLTLYFILSHRRKLVVIMLIVIIKYHAFFK